MLHDILRNKLGFESPKLGQQEIIESIMSQQHTLGILSTGSGESLCHQIPTYLSGKSILIISSLISLVDGQVMQLKINGEKHVTCICSGMGEIEKEHNIKCL